MIPPMLVLFSWPLVVIGLFRRLDVAAALCWTVVAGYLLLPGKTEINLPVLPTLDKDTVPILMALAVMLVVAQVQKAPRHGAPVTDDTLPGWLPQSRIGMILIIAIPISAFLTVLTNGDRLIYGPKVFQGLRIYDGFSAVLASLMTVLPALLARKFLAHERAHRTLLLVFCISAFVYSFPALYEVRMSPQINLHVYGFVGSDWIQNKRAGGFRPFVFLRHGLWLAIFMACAVLATVALIRLSEGRDKWKYAALAGWLFVTLFLCKTLGALAIAVLLIPAMLLFNIRAQLVTAGLVAGTILFYPAARETGLLPLDRIVSIARSIDPQRGSSLQFRLNNEDILLEKARERPLFGWGGWGRARVYDEEGRDISVTDGRWVISIGTNGWFGYLNRFGLLTLPILILAFRKRKYEVGLATSCLSLVLAGNLIDLIPNAGLTPVTWLMAGALLGRLELERDTAPDTETAMSETENRPDRTVRRPLHGEPVANAGASYSRFSPTHTRSTASKR